MQPTEPKPKPLMDINDLMALLKTEKSQTIRRHAVESQGVAGNVQAIGPLIALLTQKDRELREPIVNALGKIGSSATVSLLAALKGKDEYVRKAAAEALGKIGDRQAVKPLIDACREENMRHFAVKALGMIGDAQALKPLTDALRDKSSFIRVDAIQALGSIGDTRAAKPMIASLKDRDSLVRKTAAEVLGALGDAQAVKPLIDALRDKELRLSAAKALGQIGEGRAIEPLLAMFKETEIDLRMAAAEALGKIGAPAEERLLDALRNPDVNVRCAAAKALGDAGAKNAVEVLISAMKDDQVLWFAEEALGKIGDARAVEPLIASLERRPGDWTAVDALGKLGDPRAVKLIVSQLKLPGEGYRFARRTAAIALGEISDIQGVKPLIIALKDKDEEVRRFAREALVRIGTPAIPALSDTLMEKNASPDIARILETLGWQPEQGKMSATYWIEKRKWDECVAIGEPAVMPLLEALHNKDDQVRQAAAKTLGDIGDSRAVEPLITALNGKDGAVRKNAAEALGKIGDPRALKPIVAVLNDNEKEVRKQAAMALERFGYKPTTEEQRVRYWIANQDWDQCVQTGSPLVVAALAEMLKDRGGNIRNDAVNALEKIGTPESKQLVDKYRGKEERRKREALKPKGRRKKSYTVREFLEGTGLLWGAWDSFAGGQFLAYMREFGVEIADIYNFANPGTILPRYDVESIHSQLKTVLASRGDTDLRFESNTIRVMIKGIGRLLGTEEDSFPT